MVKDMRGSTVRKGWEAQPYKIVSLWLVVRTAGQIMSVVHVQGRNNFTSHHVHFYKIP